MYTNYIKPKILCLIFRVYHVPGTFYNKFN